LLELKSNVALGKLDKESINQASTFEKVQEKTQTQSMLMILE
jgi:hypothetical protein